MRGKFQCKICCKLYRNTDAKSHVKSCVKKLESKNDANNYLLEVLSEDWPKYWLYLAVPMNLKLKNLDMFLRKTWLKCCSHVSTMDICNQTYMSHALTNDESMNYKLKNVILNNKHIIYRYDMGDTTTLIINVLKKISTDNKKIEILARNTKPIYKCIGCNKFNSTKVCLDCYGKYCDNCVVSSYHKCDHDEDEHDGIFSQVNSPRWTGCFSYDTNLYDG